MILQSSIDMLGMEAGSAILLVGILALLLWAVISFRNPAGIALWSVTVIMVVLSGLFGVGIELVYMGLLFTALVTIVGVTARVVA